MGPLIGERQKDKYSMYSNDQTQKAATASAVETAAGQDTEVATISVAATKEANTYALKQQRISFDEFLNQI